MRVHAGMAYHSRPEDDPFITQHEDSDSDREDFLLKMSDLLILAARNEDDVSHLEVRAASTCIVTA
jgi:periodic tryptophan protein 1